MRLVAMLHAIQLLPNLAPRRFGKFTDAIQAITAPGDPLRDGLYISVGIKRHPTS